MSSELFWTGTAAVVGVYVLVTCIVALVASIHPDEKRRRDAARVLDKLLRLTRPFVLRDLGDLGDHTPPPPDPPADARGSEAISGPSTRDPVVGGPHAEPAIVDSVEAPPTEPDQAELSDKPQP